MQFLVPWQAIEWAAPLHRIAPRASYRSGMIMPVTCKVRLSEAGVHLFDRRSGLNVLLDEVDVPPQRYSLAPRYLSIALTNACELRCSYCYAPKSAAALDVGRVIAWSTELDGAGCLGIGFGGGEPTAHRQFVELCTSVARSTSMAVTFTTHGHRLTPGMVEALRGSVHFARLSVDGIGATYERLRHRPFDSVVLAANLLRSITPIGINVVVNGDTVGDLDDLAEFAVGVGASELLLLPEQPTKATSGISDADAQRLLAWLRDTRCPVRLAISRSGLESEVPVANAIPGELPLDAHMHVDATGVLRPHAYARAGTLIEGSILNAVQALRELV
ncbi:radical SAM protein [Actinospica sp. MGRD01-02]|uniref:Radical SAM protein n=1 Tax=Actinospica acidithermotolerans TaxID=2828514 RepID=A0A941ECE8_9ACTN|nr:radical SAM protein [Actinospica acidithermotolerans]MBR7828876.1 radical SAM protein [Actinospica acidithermotolerans]